LLLSECAVNEFLPIQYNVIVAIQKPERLEKPFLQHQLFWHIVLSIALSPVAVVIVVLLDVVHVGV